MLDATTGSGQQLDKRPKRAGSARLDWQEGPWRASVYADYTGTQLLPSTTTGAPSVWTPAYTIETIITSIQGLMMEDMLSKDKKEIDKARKLALDCRACGARAGA